MATSYGMAHHPVVYTALLGKLEDFDAKNDTVTAYIERAELFMDANSIPNEKRVLTLLSSIGKECYETLSNLQIRETLHGPT